MSKGKEKVGGTKHFRWLPPMHTTMLTLPAEEAVKDNKPSNTFKADSFALVAKEIYAMRRHIKKKSWYGFQLYFFNINDNICFWLL